MEYDQNSAVFRWVVMGVVCLLLTGCEHKPVDHLKRGNAHYEKGQYGQAISEYTKAIEVIGWSESALRSSWRFLRLSPVICTNTR